MLGRWSGCRAVARRAEHVQAVPELQRAAHSFQLLNALCRHLHAGYDHSVHKTAHDPSTPSKAQAKSLLATQAQPQVPRMPLMSSSTIQDSQAKSGAVASGREAAAVECAPLE